MIAGGMPPAIISTISIVAHFYTALWPSFALPLTLKRWFMALRLTLAE
jgi:hypothetical protein